MNFKTAAVVLALALVAFVKAEDKQESNAVENASSEGAAEAGPENQAGEEGANSYFYDFNELEGEHGLEREYEFFSD